MALSVTYTTINGQIVYENRNGGQSFYAPDPIGSTAMLLSPIGTVTDTYTYQPYGEIAQHIGSSATPFTYCGTIGYYLDLIGSTIYIRARHFRQALGRWQTVDPLWPSQMSYAYVESAPTIFADPSGADPLQRGRHPIPDPVGPRLPMPAPVGNPSEPWWLIPLHCVGKIGGVIGLTLLPTSTAQNDMRGRAPEGTQTCGDFEQKGYSVFWEPGNGWNNLKSTVIHCDAVGQLKTADAKACSGGSHYQQFYNCGNQKLICTMLCCPCATPDGSYSYACSGDCKKRT